MTGQEQARFEKRSRFLVFLTRFFSYLYVRTLRQARPLVPDRTWRDRRQKPELRSKRDEEV